MSEVASDGANEFDQWLAAEADAAIRSTSSVFIPEALKGIATAGLGGETYVIGGYTFFFDEDRNEQRAVEAMSKPDDSGWLNAYLNRNRLINEFEKGE